MRKSLSPYPPLDPIPAGSATKSASLAQAERLIEELQKDKKNLQRELTEVSSAYKQLITENKHEDFSERRVNFLKAQLIQLERQVVLLNEALGSRSSAIIEVENSLAVIADYCRRNLQKNDRIGEVSVPRDDLNNILRSAESARLRLYKNIENTSQDKVERPVALLDGFLRPNGRKQPTLLDVCSGHIDHLNLKHVSKLESQLSQLYKKLAAMAQTLEYVTSPVKPDLEKIPDGLKVTSAQDNHRHVPRVVWSRLGGQTAGVCNLLSDVTSSLLTLSVLVPAAPWPPLQRGPPFPEVTLDDVMKRLPPLPRSKQQEVRDVVTALVKGSRFHSHMITIERRSVQTELDFHKAIYDLQVRYISDLFKALRIGYGDFEASVQAMVCCPLRDVLAAYVTLETTASEDALKEFLKVFKGHVSQLRDAVNGLEKGELEEKDGQEAISNFGEDFLRSLDRTHDECARKRDALISDLDLVKRQYREQADEIKRLFGRDESPPDVENGRDVIGRGGQGQRDVTGGDGTRRGDVIVRDWQQNDVTRLSREERRDVTGGDGARGDDVNVRDGKIYDASRAERHDVTTNDDVREQLSARGVRQAECSCGADTGRDGGDPETRTGPDTPGPDTPAPGLPGRPDSARWDPDCDIWISQLRQSDARGGAWGRPEEDRKASRRRSGEGGDARGGGGHSGGVGWCGGGVKVNSGGALSAKPPSRPVKGLPQAKLVLKPTASRKGAPRGGTLGSPGTQDPPSPGPDTLPGSGPHPAPYRQGQSPDGAADVAHPVQRPRSGSFSGQRSPQVVRRVNQAADRSGGPRTSVWK